MVNFSENNTTKTRNFAEGTLVVDEKATIEINLKLTIHGNGAEQNPTSTSAIFINEHQVKSQTSNWQDGPSSYALSCSVVFNPGSYKIMAKELTNQRATADAIELTVREINAAADTWIILN